MDYEQLLKDALEETGVNLRISKEFLVQYTAARAAHLTTIIGQPGYDRALRAERDSIALYAGLNATLQAEAADARIVGIIQAILFGLAGGGS